MNFCELWMFLLFFLFREIHLKSYIFSKLFIYYNLSTEKKNNPQKIQNTFTIVFSILLFQFRFYLWFETFLQKELDLCIYKKEFLILHYDVIKFFTETQFYNFFLENKLPNTLSHTSFSKGFKINKIIHCYMQSKFFARYVFISSAFWIFLHFFAEYHVFHILHMAF